MDGTTAWDTFTQIIGTMVAIGAVGAALYKRIVDAGRATEPVSTELARDKLDAAGPYAPALERLHQTQTHITKAWRALPQALQQGMADAVADVDAIVHEVFGIAVEAAPVQAFLSTIDPAAIRTEIAQLETTLAETSDPQLATQYAATLDTRRDQLEQVATLERVPARVHASLSLAQAQFDAVLIDMQVVRTATARDNQARSMEFTLGDVRERLRNVRIDVTTLRDVVTATHSTTQA